ncbi:MAG: hypothetical protein QM817_32540 [Archangium sp.]
MARRERRRLVVAFGLSLLVHVCLIAVALSSERASPPPEEPQRIVLTEIRWIESKPEPKPEPAPVVVTVAPSSSKKKRSAPAQAPAKPTTGAAGTTDVPVEAPQLSAPSTDAIPTVVAESPRGRTLYPSDMPSKEELLADEQARVEERVGGFLKHGFAQARAKNGLPDPAYGELGVALRAATDDVPQFIDTNSPREVGKAFAESWLAGAERYGKTGAPYAEPEGRLESIEKPSALASAAAAGSPDAINMVNFLAAGARMQEFADGRAGLELYALVEVHQSNSGAVESVKMISPSGLKPFDAWVTEKANEVALRFTYDGGTAKHPLRSVWRFDGIMKFRRKLKPKDLDGRAAVGMIAMQVLSALSAIGNTTPPGQPGMPGSEPRDLGPRIPGMLGRFDEMTGELDMVDFTNPTYDCKVTLLEAD